ncbi:C6 transcription factor [Apiospora rasikravindrae]|uniref:C6 transcription factor n=1 Tax=Apiospora rasikravindrae TaxID=990691 RepID=A0ABR1U172_9PEZI
MVNRGKPSLDCRPCKKRKLRCDLQPDVCGQCARAGIECFGRRDPNELIVLDQTVSTKRKVQGSQQLRDSDSEAATRYPICPSELISNLPSAAAWLSIPRPLLPGLQVRARTAFLSHYVLGFSRSHGALAALYQATALDSPLSAAVDAAAILFLAKHYQAPGYPTQPVSSPDHASDLTRLATQSYMVATKRLGNTLRNVSLHSDKTKNVENTRNSAYDDETLQAVLLLDMYEKLAVAGIQRPETGSPGVDEHSWMSHVRGALSLLRASGLGQHLASPIKRRLAARLAMSLVVSCGAAGIHAPWELEQLRAGLEPYFTVAIPNASRARDQAASLPTNMWLDPKFAVTGVVVGVVNLAANVRQGSLTPDEACGRAQELDQQFVEMEQTLPPSWQCDRVITGSGYPMVYGGYYDIYSDHFVTQVRNVIRSMRLLLAKIVMECCDTNTSSLFRCGDIHITIENLCDDIVASVPQFTWTIARPENGIPFGPLQSLQCFTLLSPLYLAGQLTTRAELREWIIATMEYMADSGGLHLATTVASILRSAPRNKLLACLFNIR